MVFLPNVGPEESHIEAFLQPEMDTSSQKQIARMVPKQPKFNHEQPKFDLALI